LIEVPIRQRTQLTAAELAGISQYGARARWPEAFSIYQRGGAADGIFIVLSGTVVLRTVKGKRKFVPALVFAGETFGGEGLATNSAYATDAQAAGETETVHLTSTAFRALLREQPAYAQALIAQTFTERTALLQRVHEVCAASVDERIITALLRLFDGRTGSSEEQLALGPADHRLLCEIVGATRESITQALGRLVVSGLATREGGSFRVSRSRLLDDRFAQSGATEREINRRVLVEARAS
jgi:CRP/FNR family transcriptional regulator, cyclic AMP receptor protein